MTRVCNLHSKKRYLDSRRPICGHCGKMVLEARVEVSTGCHKCQCKICPRYKVLGERLTNAGLIYDLKMVWSWYIMNLVMNVAELWDWMCSDLGTVRRMNFMNGFFDSTECYLQIFIHCMTGIYDTFKNFTGNVRESHNRTLSALWPYLASINNGESRFPETWTDQRNHSGTQCSTWSFHSFRFFHLTVTTPATHI